MTCLSLLYCHQSAVGPWLRVHNVPCRSDNHALHNNVRQLQDANTNAVEAAVYFSLKLRGQSIGAASVRRSSNNDLLKWYVLLMHFASVFLG